MTQEIVRSKRGVMMTKRTTYIMRKFLADIARSGGTAISYSIARLRDGTWQLALGGDYAAQPAAIPDEVEGIAFYWYAGQPELAALEDHVVDTPYDGPTRLIPLHEVSGLDDAK